MANSFSQFLNLFTQSASLKIAVSLSILAVGYAIARSIPKIRKWLIKRKYSEDKTKEIKENRKKETGPAEITVIIITILISLAFLNASLTFNLLNNSLKNAQQAITTILIIVLGIIVANYSIDLIRRFLKTFHQQTSDEIGISEKSLDIIFFGVKLFLYILIVEIAATQVGFSFQLLEKTLTAASYAVVFLLALIAFVGFKDLIENYTAGIYLRGSNMLKPGKKVKVNDERGEVRNVSKYSTTISTDSGYFMLVPNSALKEKEIMFKRSRAEVDTLEDIKRYFTANKTEKSDIASTEILLAIFGYDIKQEKIEQEKGEKSLNQAIEKLTNGEVKTANVPYKKITNLRDEFKSWFNDGGLVLLDYMKPNIFPEADRGNTVLCAGVEGDEILVIDPSPENGGVYYIDYKDLMTAMKEYEDPKGYTVIAPKNTTAQWRIKKNLIYSHPELYDELSKSLEVQLSKILRQSRILKTVMPESVTDFVEKWRSDQKVNRIWEPESKKEEDK